MMNNNIAKYGWGASHRQAYDEEHANDDPNEERAEDDRWSWLRQQRENLFKRVALLRQKRNEIVAQIAHEETQIVMIEAELDTIAHH